MIAEIIAALGAELDRLSDELTKSLAIDPHINPDAPRNGTGPDRNQALQREIRILGQLVAGLAAADSTTLSADRIGYGSNVTIRSLRGGPDESYTLMDGEFIDLDEGHVSLASPLGHALIGRTVGDRVVVMTPRGERRYEIVSATTLPQRVGIVGPRKSSRPAAGSLQVA